jgi:hypothetical protein
MKPNEIPRHDWGPARMPGDYECRKCGAWTTYGLSAADIAVRCPGPCDGGDDADRKDQSVR